MATAAVARRNSHAEECFTEPTPCPVECAEPWPVRFALAGLYVFPCEPGAKVPIRGLKWKEKAINDAAAVRRAVAKRPDWNWAVAPWLSGHVVLDVDVKKGQDGFKTLREHGLLLPEDSFRVSTPNGGIHVYFKGVTRSSTGFLPGLDAKSEGGYVLIPGSVVDGKPYEVISGSLGDDFPDAPEWLCRLTGPRTERDPGESREPLVELDLEHNVEQAIRYLEGPAPEAHEGLGGDSATLQVAMRVKDFGISEQETLRLMAEFWNDYKAYPPWRLDELAVKVHNGHKYGRNRGGIKSVEEMFSNRPTGGLGIEAWSQWDAATRAARKWVLGTRYAVGYVTMTVADGGVGKSSLTIAEAVAVATGRPLTGMEVNKKGAVLITNLEDPQDEIRNKIDAVGIEHGIPLAERREVFATSGYGKDWRLVGPGGVENKELVEQITKNLCEIEAVLWVVDPFVYLHGVDENKNTDMGLVMRALSGIAEQAQVAISVVHHSRKPGSGMTEGSEGGDMHVSRGATSVMAAARIAHTLGVMGKKTAEAYNIDEVERKWYVKLEEAKANMSPPMAKDTWFKRVSVPMPNGDLVGTLRPVALLNRPSRPEPGLVDMVRRLDFRPRGVLTIRQAFLQLRDMGLAGPRGATDDKTLRNILNDCMDYYDHGIDGDDFIVKRVSKGLAIEHRVGDLGDYRETPTFS